MGRADEAQRLRDLIDGKTKEEPVAEIPAVGRRAKAIPSFPCTRADGA